MEWVRLVFCLYSDSGFLPAEVEMSAQIALLFHSSLSFATDRFLLVRAELTYLLFPVCRSGHRCGTVSQREIIPDESAREVCATRCVAVCACSVCECIGSCLLVLTQAFVFPAVCVLPWSPHRANVPAGEGFGVSHTFDSYTKGIWVWPKPIKVCGCPV